MRKYKNHSIDVVFVLLLFCAFAASALMTLLFGTSSYSKVTDTMEQNYRLRVYSGYIAEKLRHCENAESIQIGKFGGQDAIIMNSTAGGEKCVTYIYYYDGSIRELFTEQDSGLGPEAGEVIIEAAGFRAEYVGEDLAKAACRDSDGNESYTIFSLNQ